MDGAIVLNANATKIAMANVQLMPGPDDPLARDRHAPSHGRARLQADRRARDRDLPATRGRLALRRRREVHPRGHPRRARQGQPGARDARQVPHAPRPGLDAPDGARVRGRRHAPRRADGAPALRARDAHGRRDRALHRRARHRGPADRDAARGDDGRHRRRQGRARARLPRRGRRRGVRRGARPARPPAAPGPARLRAARRAARLRPQAQHARLPRVAARLPDPRAHPAPAEDRGAEHRPRLRRARRAARRDRRGARGASRASERSARRTSARACAGCRRSISWIGTCRRERHRADGTDRARTPGR